MTISPFYRRLSFIDDIEVILDNGNFDISHLYNLEGYNTVPLTIGIEQIISKNCESILILS